MPATTTPTDQKPKIDQLGTAAASQLRCSSALKKRGVPVGHVDGDIDQAQLGRDHAGEQQARPPAILGAEIGQRKPQGTCAGPMITLLMRNTR